MVGLRYGVGVWWAMVVWWSAWVLAGQKRGWQGPGHEVLYGRPSASPKNGIQKPVQNWLISALPDLGGVFERGWCNIWWFSGVGGGLVSAFDELRVLGQ